VYRSKTLQRPTLAIAALAIVALALTYLARPAIVHADGSLPWGGNGSDNLPCANGAHWVLAPAFNVDSATLVVDGVEYTMTQNGQGSWAADAAGAVTADSDVSVNFTGDGDLRNHLQLSHCLAGTPEEELFPLGLSKVDQNGDPIAGVEFTLTGVTDASVNVSGKTEADGTLTFSDLAAGDYTLTETAPEGCTGIDPIGLSIDNKGAVSFSGAHDSATIDADGNLVIENTCSEGGQQGATPTPSPKESPKESPKHSPEGGVQAATPVASASTPNTAFTAPASTSGGTLLAGMLLLVSLITLAAVNVRTARRRR